ncbi:MAG: hypothetical protein EOP06_29035 [Proteobacteria bacterium]|nr:MAG: hypothetical protein EOP06_29035 [Pseudomonadota bacterium]
MKDPLLIERECFSRAVYSRNAKPTEDEIRAFLKEALPMRFNTEGTIKDGFLAINETMLREKDLSTLAQRQISQKVLVDEIKIDPKLITANLDRVVSVGKIKSVLPLILIITVQETTRSENNPYGLIITSIDQPEDKPERK